MVIGRGGGFEMYEPEISRNHCKLSVAYHEGGRPLATLSALGGVVLYQNGAERQKLEKGASVQVGLLWATLSTWVTRSVIRVDCNVWSRGKQVHFSCNSLVS